jgi:L,D-peptidoglycan transpeptidase YkuD (ErfK/YbiS/YcfS/YnhG family)
LAFGTGSASQVITVVALSAGSTSATVQAWDRVSGGWVRHGPAVPARIGSRGMTTHPSESLSATPVGSFTLTLAFGRVGNPGTGVPYFVANTSDWWVSDVKSPYYNTHYRCSSACPFDTGAGENLYGAGSVYNYAVVIDYNRFPVRRGAGSAFFLHISNGAATAGCVAVSSAHLVSIMRWLSPARHPRILMGVG